MQDVNSQSLLLHKCYHSGSLIKRWAGSQPFPWAHLPIWRRTVYSLCKSILAVLSLGKSESSHRLLGFRQGQWPSEQVGLDIEWGCGYWRLPHLRSVTLWVWGCCSPRCPWKTDIAHTSSHILRAQLSPGYDSWPDCTGCCGATKWLQYKKPLIPLPACCCWSSSSNSSSFLKIQTVDFRFSSLLRMVHTHTLPTQNGPYPSWRMLL